ncbi:ThuA domain-containing protein [Sphingomonas sp. S1-29]|uniref:ThuA domain-containing protein n=1 Tax=Sphingomonas sp. S1-29 TaxID=2991074 RepID=UPI00223F0C8F|nr:ThuA domain-containing protein [Sphingomonas sp. S1-29]UZK69737.1 ThuA domain-containing protein [Sphingomonas sp. S1-29]
MTLYRLVLLFLSIVLLPTDAFAAPARVLVFSHTTGYRHASIEAGVAALKRMGTQRDFTVIASEDPAIFSPQKLKDIDAIVFLSSTTNPADPASEWLVGDRRAALQAFVRGGGGIVAVHGAADSHLAWPWYGQMIGGWFESHPRGTPTGDVTIVDSKHPAAGGMTGKQRRADEWYYFKDFDPTVDLLATVDPASIGEKDANPNPAAWAHEFEGGRVFYTAMGHADASFSEPWYLQHLGAGLDWALRRR